MLIKIAETEAEILQCFAVLSELRPRLVTDTFLDTIKRLEKATQFQAHNKAHPIPVALHQNISGSVNTGNIHRT